MSHLRSCYLARLFLLMKPNSLLRRLFIGCLSVSFVLAGCGGNNATPPASGVGSGPFETTYHWWFNIYNDTDKNDAQHPKGEYIWVTRYWDDHNVFHPYQIVGADCIAPGQAIQRDIKFPRTADPESEAVKLRVEVKAYDAKNCSADTISDFYSDKCSGYIQTSGHPIDYWFLGTAKVVVRPPHFQWDLHCKDTEGGGSPPPLTPAVMKHASPYRKG